MQMVKSSLASVSLKTPNVLNFVGRSNQIVEVAPSKISFHCTGVALDMGYEPNPLNADSLSPLLLALSSLLRMSSLLLALSLLLILSSQLQAGDLARNTHLHMLTVSSCTLVFMCSYTLSSFTSLLVKV